MKFVYLEKRRGTCTVGLRSGTRNENDKRIEVTGKRSRGIHVREVSLYGNVYIEGVLPERPVC